MQKAYIFGTMDIHCMTIASKKKRIPNSKKWWKNPERRAIVVRKISNTMKKQCGKPERKAKFLPSIIIRETDLYKEQRELAKKRDDHTCQTCGFKYKPYTKADKGHYPLHVHHIKAMYSIVKANRIESLEEAMECKELFNLDNLQTICVPCHKGTSDYLGKSSYHTEG